jgi:hypothetical protein
MTKQIPMASTADDEQRLERHLLIRGVGALRADRDCCADCGRTPLIGEQIHLYETSRATQLVCELCRQLRRESPVATDLVRHSERGHTVRITARAA